jgi:BolA family transcriptional regulator, general stress-responsive regulator
MMGGLINGKELDMGLGPVGVEMRRKLSEAFAPEALEVIDESHLHAGHSGARPEGETHFRVRIVSKAFAGQTRVAQQRLVNAVVAEELKTRVHALALETRAPA